MHVILLFWSESCSSSWGPRFPTKVPRDLVPNRLKGTVPGLSKSKRPVLEGQRWWVGTDADVRLSTVVAIDPFTHTRTTRGRFEIDVISVTTRKRTPDVNRLGSRSQTKRYGTSKSTTPSLGLFPKSASPGRLIVLFRTRPKGPAKCKRTGLQSAELTRHGLKSVTSQMKLRFLPVPCVRDTSYLHRGLLNPSETCRKGTTPSLADSVSSYDSGLTRSWFSSRISFTPTKCTLLVLAPARGLLPLSVGFCQSPLLTEHTRLDMRWGITLHLKLHPLLFLLRTFRSLPVRYPEVYGTFPETKIESSFPVTFRRGTSEDVGGWPSKFRPDDLPGNPHWRVVTVLTSGQRDIHLLP